MSAPTEPVTVPEHGITPTVVAVASRGQVVAADVNQDVIDHVVESVRRLCGWHVWPVRTEDVSVRDYGDEAVLFPTLRLLEVADMVTGGVEVDPSGYEVYEDGTVDIPYRAPFPYPRKLTATITHGFDEAPGLVDVVANMVVRSVAGTGDGALSVGGVSYNSGTGVTPKTSEWVIIDRYKLGPRP